MWNEPTAAQLATLPKLYATEKTPARDTLIHLHFFIGGCDWYIAEYDGQDTFFGYANLNDDNNAEWGYISFQELKSLNLNGLEVDCDLHWPIKPASEIPKIILK